MLCLVRRIGEVFVVYRQIGQPLTRLRLEHAAYDEVFLLEFPPDRSKARLLPLRLERCRALLDPFQLVTVRYIGPNGRHQGANQYQFAFDLPDDVTVDRVELFERKRQDARAAITPAVPAEERR